jgi:hypothetical protein
MTGLLQRDFEGFHHVIVASLTIWKVNGPSPSSG